MRNIFRFVSKVTIVTMISLLFSSSFTMAEEVSGDVIIPVDESILNEASDEVASSEDLNVPTIPEAQVATVVLETPAVSEITEVQGTTETLETPDVLEIPEVAKVLETPDVSSEVASETTVSPSEAEPCLEAESLGTVIDVETVSVGSAFDATSTSVDTLSAESVESNEAILSAESVESSETQFSVAAATTYSQPLWNTKEGYDAVCLYLTDVSGDYVQRCFLVTDGKQWLLYDYGEYAAGEFFSQAELKNGKYVPVQKAAMRSDNTDTVGIDESKIPTMAKTSFDSMVYDWKNLDDVPFNRNANGAIIYAGSSSSNKKDPNEEEAKSSTASTNKYTVNIGDNSYTVYLTATVSYNGRRHVRNTVVASKKYSPDLTVSVYRNGKLLDSRYYTLKYGNNLNVNGYGKEGISPYIRVNLKNVKGLKQDKKVLASYKFKFTIKPVDISKAQLTVKKIRVTNGTKVKLGTPKAKLDGLSISLKAQSSKNPLTGVYKATASGNVITVRGVNNFTGSTTLNLSNAKTIDWVF